MVRQQRKIVTFIALIVILTISIQTYWNYVQYDNNRIQIIVELQNILDKVSTDYTKNNTKKSLLKAGATTSEIETIKLDSIQKIAKRILKESRSTIQLNQKKIGESSISYRIIYDSVNLADFDKMLKKELKNKNYNINYYLTLTKKGKVINSYGQPIKTFTILSAKSQLAPLELTSEINLNYANPILPSLLKGLTGIILSLVLCSIVVFSLYYLLYIIRKQKQLSEIKHDFISNVTHEFKTPIATVSSAIEAIKNFNNENISDKTKRYLDISEQQLKKLNILVEKVMETSLLESSELNFDYINTDIIQLIKNSAEKHQMNTNKNIHFESIVKILVMDIDEFHFENAISNLIDNAVKYGGNTINISINKSSEECLFISINDNGEGISKLDEPYIFDKFYRTKTKNIHNIKGFGIGLYYAKNIIEKHKGIIELKNRNTFLITLWTK